MKNKVFWAVLGCLFLLNFAFAQEKPKKTQTISFQVQGVCSMCEMRIEEAALIKGVKFADWGKETKMIKVIFNTAKTDALTIHQAIAKAGHDTELVKSDSLIYKNLPDCCAYRSGLSTH